MMLFLRWISFSITKYMIRISLLGKEYTKEMDSISNTAM